MYRFEGALSSITPYAGAGPGLYLHQATTQALSATTGEVNIGGFLAAVGYRLRL